jgi:hypothetical protein
MKAKNWTVKKENEIIEALDAKHEMIALFDEYYPVLKELAEVGDVEQLLKKNAPIAVLTLIKEMATAGKSRERIEAATKLAYMAGYKPVERNINIEGNIDRMSEPQLDTLLGSAFKKMTDKDKKLMRKLIKVSENTYIEEK